MPIGADLQAELDAYAEIGYFGDADTSTAEGRYDPDLVAGLYEDGTVVWPAG